MKVKDLRLALSRQAIGLTSEEVRAVDQLLMPADEMTVAEFCAATKIKISKPKRPRAAPKVNDVVVSGYVSELRSNISTDASKATIERIKKDKAVKVAEARAIATQVVGERTYNTKSDALKAIEKRRVANARASHRRSHISDIF